VPLKIISLFYTQPQGLCVIPFWVPLCLFTSADGWQ